MKNNLLSAAALTVVLVAGVAWAFRPAAETPEITLPEIEITTAAKVREIALPEVTISAKQRNIATIALPEVTIRAKKRLRV